VSLDEVAHAAFAPQRLPPGLDLGLSGSAIVTPLNATFPNGCHVCEVEIDQETGTIRLVRYAGGVAQGAGQALFEAIAYEPTSGQLVSGSFMDYCMPRADDLPFYATGENEVPSPNNPFGVKGAGEAGAVGSLPAVMNAVNDALAPLGIRHFDMPATPERLWEAIRSATTTR
jgi:carbon-monoxide dehydrogenase large subunit